MIAFALVLEDAIGDCYTLIRGEMPGQVFAQFLLAVRRVNDFLPQLRVVVGGHTVTQVVIQEGRYRLEGEPVPQAPAG